MSKPIDKSLAITIIAVIQIIWISIMAVGYVKKETRDQHTNLKSCVESNLDKPLTCFTEKKNE